MFVTKQKFVCSPFVFCVVLALMTIQGTSMRKFPLVMLKIVICTIFRKIL